LSGLVLMTKLSSPRCELLTGASFLKVTAERVARGSANFFCYRDDAGTRLRFILARGEDGTVRSVLDACQQCYKFHKGFDVAGGYLICRLCGNRYPIGNMVAGKASCVPVTLPASESGGEIHVSVADLKKNAWLF